MARKIIIDTDPGQDDAVAILLALASPEIEVLGITDIVAKSHGTSNPYNMVRATFDALTNSTTPAEVAAKRGKSVEELFA